jgi:PilZ domain
MASVHPGQETAPFCERRRLPRTDVAIWVEERTNDALYYQRATNLSLGGIWLDGTLPHPPGTRVALDIELPGEGPLRVNGEVVPRQAGASGMAVRFVGLSEAGRERIALLLAAQA